MRRLIGLAMAMLVLSGCSLERFSSEPEAAPSADWEAFGAALVSEESVAQGLIDRVLLRESDLAQGSRLLPSSTLADGTTGDGSGGLCVGSSPDQPLAHDGVVLDGWKRTGFVMTHEVTVYSDGRAAKRAVAAVRRSMADCPGSSVENVQVDVDTFPVVPNLMMIAFSTVKDVEVVTAMVIQRRGSVVSVNGLSFGSSRDATRQLLALRKQALATGRRLAKLDTGAPV